MPSTVITEQGRQRKTHLCMDIIALCSGRVAGYLNLTPWTN